MSIVINYTKRGDIDPSVFENLFGTICEGVNLDKFFGSYWNVIILIRWTLTSIIMVLLRDYYYFQIQSLLLISIFTQIEIIVGRPMAGNYENEIALFNEAMVCVYLYLMMTLTDFNHDQHFRLECSLSLAVIVLLSAGVNFIKFAVLLSKEIYRTVKIKYYQYRRA